MLSADRPRELHEPTAPRSPITYAFEKTPKVEFKGLLLFGHGHL
jgi:hypothetical protein